MTVPRCALPDVDGANPEFTRTAGFTHRNGQGRQLRAASPAVTGRCFIDRQRTHLLPVGFLCPLVRRGGRKECAGQADTRP